MGSTDVQRTQKIQILEQNNEIDHTGMHTDKFSSVHSCGYLKCVAMMHQMKEIEYSPLQNKHAAL